MVPPGTPRCAPLTTTTLPLGSSTASANTRLRAHGQGGMKFCGNERCSGCSWNLEWLHTWHAGWPNWSQMLPNPRMADSPVEHGPPLLLPTGHRCQSWGACIAGYSGGGGGGDSPVGHGLPLLLASELVVAVELAGQGVRHGGQLVAEHVVGRWRVADACSERNAAESDRGGRRVHAWQVGRCRCLQGTARGRARGWAQDVVLAGEAYAGAC